MSGAAEAAARRARRAADARRRRAGIVAPRRPRAVAAIACIHCHAEIIGYPDGWMHVADRRRFADDGHEAEPFTIA